VPATVSTERFAEAQDAEFKVWLKRSKDPLWIRRELLEHSEISGPLRDITGSRRFQRGLEVGIGAFGLGLLASHFADRIVNIEGLDPLPKLAITMLDSGLQSQIELIRSRVTYVQSTAESMPFASASYDVVSCINVVDHSQAPHAIVREINRVLKPGGILVFAVSTLSLLGEVNWAIRRTLSPDAFLFVAHPHTFQWYKANSLLKQVPGQTLWNDKPSCTRAIAGHGRMSFWIRRKKT
jgi:2-polyprenyl-3-methyl-5-hydroxy-6-metoxy-1,4-benzoquinol methylase